MSGVLGRNLIRPGLAIGMMFVRIVLVSTFLRSLAQCLRNIGDGRYGLGCRCRRLDSVGCTMLIALGVHIVHIMIMMMFVIMRMLVFVVVMMMRRFIVMVGSVVMMRAIMDVMDVVIVVFVGVSVSILRLC